MKLLVKDPFVEFVAEFKLLPWNLRKEILSDYTDKTEIERLRSLYRDIVNESVDVDEWKSLYKTLQIIDSN
jgi:hypothetical protein